MKKILSIWVFVLCIVNSYSEGLSIKGGILAGQKIESEFSGDVEKANVDEGFKIDLAYDFKINRNFDFGLGFELVSSELEYENGGLGDFSQHPIYAQAKYNFRREHPSNHYLIGRFGYPLLFEDGKIENDEIKSKFYWSLGFGVEVDNFIVEILFEKSTYEEKYYWVNTNIYAGDGDSEIERISISLGYNFGRDYKKVSGGLKDE